MFWAFLEISKSQKFTWKYYFPLLSRQPGLEGEWILWCLLGSLNTHLLHYVAFWYLCSHWNQTDSGQRKDKGLRQRIRQPKGMFILKYGHSLPLQPVVAYDGCFPETKTKKKKKHKYYECRIQRSRKIRKLSSLGKHIGPLSHVLWSL